MAYSDVTQKCTACASGTFQPLNNATEACRPFSVASCPAGFSLRPGTAAADAQCLAAPGDNNDSGDGDSSDASRGSGGSSSATGIAAGVVVAVVLLLALVLAVLLARRRKSRRPYITPASKSMLTDNVVPMNDNPMFQAVPKAPSQQTANPMYESGPAAGERAADVDYQTTRVPNSLYAESAASASGDGFSQNSLYAGLHMGDLLLSSAANVNDPAYARVAYFSTAKDGAYHEGFDSQGLTYGVPVDLGHTLPNAYEEMNV